MAFSSLTFFCVNIGAASEEPNRDSGNPDKDSRVYEEHEPGNNGSTVATPVCPCHLGYYNEQDDYGAIRRSTITNLYYW